MRREILGVGFDAVTMDEAVARALSLMKERRGAYVCTPNPEIVWSCQKDEALKMAVNGADLVLPDGAGVVWASGLLSRALPERVAGVDFAQKLLATMEGSVYLLGGKPGVAERAAAEIRRRYEGVTAVRCQDGYFDDEEAVAREIRAARPDLLLLCLGAPKQERLMQKWAGSPEIGLMAGLGGTVDILAGDVRRAPEFFLRHRMEWLYRLGQNPRRIKRTGRLLCFALAVWKQRIQHGKGKTDRTGRH